MPRILSGMGAAPRHHARASPPAAGCSPSDRLRFTNRQPARAVYRCRSKDLETQKPRGRSKRCVCGGSSPASSSPRSSCSLFPGRLSQLPTGCRARFRPSEIAWLQRALDGWHQVSRQFLLIDPSPLPWIVLFDASCVWHLSSDSTLIREAVPVQTTLTFAGRPFRSAR